MWNCAKCGAELIGSAKFCATCGAPSPRAAEINALSTTSPSDPSEPPGPPPAVRVNVAHEVPAPVNPFAATASPSSAVSKAVSRVGESEKLASEAPKADQASGLPPSSKPHEPPHISPLAVSNAISHRGAFQQAIESAKEMARAVTPAGPVEEPAKAKKPSTQVMPSRPQPAPEQPAKEELAKKAARTVAMGFVPKLNVSAAPLSVAPNTTPGGSGVPSAVAGSGVPSAVAGSVRQNTYPPQPSQHAPYVAPQTGAPYNQPYAPPQPQPQAQRPWTPPQPAYQAYPYPFGYTPGSRVHVTWSNGQRYPATVNQVSGSQCLVVFPDGQQHWIDMQYLSPG